MFGRRKILGGAFVLAVTALTVVVLGGCGLLGPNLAEQVQEAVQEVDGVEAAEFETSVGAMFESNLRGTITLAATDRAEMLRIYDDAMEQVGRVLFDQDEGGYRVGGINGVSPPGNELTIDDLGIRSPHSDRLDRVTGEVLFEHYGIS